MRTSPKITERLLSIIGPEVKTQIAFIQSEIKTAQPGQELFGCYMALESMCLLSKLLEDHNFDAFCAAISRIESGDMYFVSKDCK